MSRNTIMLVGLGELGGHVLEMLVRTPGNRRIVTADVDEDRAYRKTQIAIYGASQMGFYPDVEFTKIDVNNKEQAAEVINRVNPDVIYSAATLQSWWVITTLPKPVFDDLDKARFGPWLPMHLSVVYKLMQAVKATGKDYKVINSAFPDACGPILKTRGLNPSVGIGNVANPVPAIRLGIADQLGVKLGDVKIYLACQHYVSHYIPRFGTAGGAPYYLRAFVGGKDVTKDVDIDKVFADAPKKYRRTGGLGGQILTASSAAAITLAMADDRREFLHAPAPDGLPGGYPVRVDANGATVDLPNDLSLEEAIRINEVGQAVDGIERIDENGTAYIPEWSNDIMKRMIGFDCKVMPLDDIHEIAAELGAKFKAFAAQYTK
jgi:hypothetical protein